MQDLRQYSAAGSDRDHSTGYRSGHRLHRPGGTAIAYAAASQRASACCNKWNRVRRWRRQIVCNRQALAKIVCNQGAAAVTGDRCMGIEWPSPESTFPGAIAICDVPASLLWSLGLLSFRTLRRNGQLVRLRLNVSSADTAQKTALGNTFIAPKDWSFASADPPPSLKRRRATPGRTGRYSGQVA